MRAHTGREYDTLKINVSAAAAVRMCPLRRARRDEFGHGVGVSRMVAGVIADRKSLYTFSIAVIFLMTSVA